MFIIFSQQILNDELLLLLEKKNLIINLNL